MKPFKIIIVEDVLLELKGTEGIIKNDIPEAEIIGTADSEVAYWKLMKQQLPASPPSAWRYAGRRRSNTQR